MDMMLISAEEEGKKIGADWRTWGWVHQSATVFRLFLSLSEYFAILVTINHDAQWNQSDSVWDRVLNFENFLKAITLSCIYE